jgi:hypothetical protein
MPRKHHKPEEIVAKLRQVDVWVSQGKSVADSIRAIGVTEVTYSLGYKPPAPEVFIPALAARAASQPRPATLPALAEKPTMN